MSYTDWLTAKITIYTNAITSAYSNSGLGNNLDLAWIAMSTDSIVLLPDSFNDTLSSILPPSNDNFYGENPTADEDDVNAFEAWLDNHRTEAEYLGLKSTYQNTDDTNRKDLGAAGNIGTEKRKWKGSAQYTFANGILIGKNEKIIAAIGTDGKTAGGSTISGYGTDTLIFFDGIIGSKGTSLPGTAVFAGDVVVSGSIQGDAGIIIIDDVIQLEQGIDNPAGIGVGPDGKIRLRHRGESFLDLIDEDERRQIEDKRFVTGQNTSSQRYGTSLIPNSGFAYLESTQTGEYAEQIANIATLGQTTTAVGITGGSILGVAQLDYTTNANLGLAFQAIPISSERYSVRIRFKGSVAADLDDNTEQEGLFLEFHETTVEDINEFEHDKFYIHSNTGQSGALISDKNGALPPDQLFHTQADVSSPDAITVTRPALSWREDDGGFTDGISIPTDYIVKTFMYTRSSDDVKNVSLILFAKNYPGTLYIDYIVMTEAPSTTTEIRAEAVTAAADIVLEVDNDITDAKMSDISNWAALGGNSEIFDSTDGEANGDEAILLTITSSTGDTDGILSSPSSCDSDKYLVGVRIKALNNTTASVKLLAVEDTGTSFSTMTPLPSSPLTSLIVSNRVDVDTIIVDDAGTETSGPGSSQSVPDADADIEIHGDWVNILGTYTATTTIGSESPYTVETPSQFCLGLEVSSYTLGAGGTNCDLLIDYFYCKPQSASGDLAALLADEAYGDAEGFVTSMNELLIGESGSIIVNASMSALDSNGIPACYRSPNTLSLQQDNSDRQIKIAGDPETTRYLISPPFQLEADRISIGVRAKSVGSAGTLTVKVVYLGAGGTAGQLPVDKVTLAPDDIGAPADVQTVAADSDPPQIDTVSLDSGSLNTSTYVSCLGTWDRTPIVDGLAVTDAVSHTSKVAALLLECDEDFIVDYILVKEQMCSYNLADAAALQRRDEAVALASNELSGLNNAMNQEQGSLLANSTFAAYDYNSDIDYQVPKNWAITREGRDDGTSLYRVVSTSEGGIERSTGQSIDIPGEQTNGSFGFLGGGCFVRHYSTGTFGLLSSYFTLPAAGSAGTVEVSGATSEPTGRYLIAIQLKSVSPYAGSPDWHKSGLRILAHETFDIPTTQFALCTSSTAADYDDIFVTGVATKVESAYTSGTGWSFTGTSYTEGAANTDGKTKKIQLINLSDSDDVVVGYDTDVSYDTSAGDDKYIETWNDDQWHTIGGTYTPTDGMRYVSFEFIFETDSGNQQYGIDYITLTPQSIDADFADTLAQARVEGAIDNLQDEPQLPGNLIVNPYFSSANLTSATDTFPQSWLSSGPNYDGGTDFNTYTETDRFEYIDSTNKVGLKVKPQVSSGGIGCVISKAFKPTAGDYLVEVRLRTMADDASNGFNVYALEYNSELTGTQAYVRNDDVNTVAVNQSKGPAYSNLELLGAITNTDDGAMQTHTFEYDPAFTTDSSNNITITPKWTSIGVFPTTNTDQTKGYQIESITCVPDPTATGNRLFGDYQGVDSQNMLQNTGGTRSHTYFTKNVNLGQMCAVHIGSIGDLYNQGVSGMYNVSVSNPTEPENPVLDLVAAGISRGHSLVVKTDDYGGNCSYTGSTYGRVFGSGTTHKSNNELALTDDTNDERYAANNRFRGLVYAAEAHYYQESSSNTYLKGVSFYSPEVTPWIGIDAAGTSLWFKHTHAGGARLRFYDNNSEINWSIFYYDEHPIDNKLYFEHSVNMESAYIDGDVNNGWSSFTGQHRSIPLNQSLKEKIGMICISTGEYDTRYVDDDKKQITINDCHPIIDLSSRRNQKSVFGVISGEEEILIGPSGNKGVAFQVGAFGTPLPVSDDDHERLLINSIGEGGIWVCNINGNLENGDYITTCEIPGYGMKQDDDILHNYTVAKITQDCNFRINAKNYDVVEFEHEGKTYRKAFVGCTYHCG